MGEPTPIRIGNQTAFSARRPLDPFRFALRSGFDAFEWFEDRKDTRGFHFDKLDDGQRRRLRRLSRRRNIEYTVHAPTGVDPTSPTCVGDLYRTLRFAEAIAASHVVVHYPDGSAPEAVAPVLRSLASATPGMRLAVENTPATTPATLTALFADLPKDEGSPSVGLCLDIGHANLCAATPNDYLGYFDAVASTVPLFEVHAHENFGDADTHLPLFTGPSRADAAGIAGLLHRLVARGFTGPIIMEQWPEPPSLLRTARDRLTAMVPEVTSRAKEPR